MDIMDFLTQALQLPDPDLNRRLMELVSVRTLERRDLVIRAGDQQNYVSFLMEGVLRGFFMDVNGHEITDCFCALPGHPAMSCLSLDTPSPISIEALTRSTILTIPVAVAAPLLHSEPHLMRMYNRMLIEALGQHWEIKTALYQYTAAERYQWFLRTYPGLTGCASGRHIASFLGMTPVTLSRLRRALREQGEPVGDFEKV